MNKVGKTFEELNTKEMHNIHGGGPQGALLSAFSPTTTIPCFVGASVSVSVSVAVSYYTTR